MARGILTRPIEDLGPRGWFFLLLGSAIAQLLLITADRFYGREYRNGSLFLLAAVALAIVFFRKRKIALAICGLSYYIVMAGLTAPFHPSLLAWGLAIGSAASLYMIVRWSAKRYPFLSYKQKHIVFDGEAAMAAENARIEALHRELIKSRPYGPWLIR
jgi:hypothetical protein